MTVTADEARKRNGSAFLRGKRAGALLFAACLLLSFGLYGEVLGYALVGHDTYPIILTARIGGIADFAGTFTEELMDGRYTQGRFYRPALNLSFALDHALFGLNPRGYHATDIVLLGVAALLLAFAAGPRGALTGAGLAAAALFLVHPVHLNVLPVPARRGDTLSLIFLLLALHGATRTGKFRLWGPALFTLLALGAKEIALIGPVLLFARVLLGPEPREGRLRRAFLLSLPPFGAVALFAIARHAVLGGVGGHGELSAGAVASHALRILPDFERITWYPYPVFASILPGPAVRVLLIILFALLSIVFLRRAPVRGLGLFAWIWMIAGWGAHGLTQAISPWYGIHTVMPFALLSGILIVEGVGTARRRGRAALRAGGAAAAAILLLMGGVNLRHAPPFAFHPEWKDATRMTNMFLDDLETRIEAAPEGSTIDVGGLPYISRYRPGSPIVLVASLADYTVQAWSELTLPERRVRVAFPLPPPEPPADGEILVIVRVDR